MENLERSAVKMTHVALRLATPSCTPPRVLQPWGLYLAMKARIADQNRPAKHGVLPGSVAELKCTGENYTGRIWELVSVLVFAQVSTVTP